MFTFFMALATCRGEKFNFLAIYFQAFEIFPYPFDHGDGFWFLTKAQFTSRPHFMCLEGLHIVNLELNKSLKLELLGFRALITHFTTRCP